MSSSETLDPARQFDLGNALARQGDLEGAVASFRACVQLRPDWMAAWYNLGNGLQSLHRPLEAAQAYRETLRLKPDFAEAHNNLGTALLKAGQIREAIESYQHALSLRPDFAEACFNLGSAYRDASRMADGVRCYRRALELQPGLAARDRQAFHIQQELLFLGRYQEASKDILVVVHDQLDYLRECVDSVRECTRDYHVYIWDNGSKADTQAYLRDLKSAHPDEVDVVRIDSNIGFVEANNGLAVLGSAEYVILLNSDTKVGDGWDRAMIAWLQEHAECALTGYLGGVLDGEGIALPGGGHGDRIDYVCGFCACLRRATYQAFGLFDPDIRFAYFEDTDLSLRLKAAGKGIYALHLGLVHHYDRKTTRALEGDDKRRLREAFEYNHGYFRRKWKTYLETARVGLGAGGRLGSERRS